VPVLLRDNAADDRVAADIERLAGAYDSDSVAATDARIDAARAADLELLAASYQVETEASAAPWWREPLTHITRYRTLYALLAAVIAVLLFRNPVPKPIAAGGDEETTVVQGPGATSAAATEDFGLPTPDPSGLDFAGPLDFTAPDELDSPLDSSSVSFSPEPDVPAAPTRLTIAQSGYMSTFAGTPIDQSPPGNGLPVEMLANSTTKYSYFRLAGGGRTLKLKMLTDNGASLNDGAATVQACHLTSSSWKATRGAPTADAPKFDSDCVLGKRATDGTWSFTFVLSDPLDRNGWAIVPLDTNGSTFRITFAPAAV
jgi:hypothetical protein